MIKMNLHRNRRAILIVGLLMVANFSVILLLQKQSSSARLEAKGLRVQEMEYVEEGLQIINWSYALLKYFKGNPLPQVYAQGMGVNGM